MTTTSDFVEILTSLFHGNAGAAEQQAETVIYDNTYSLDEEWERIRQNRVNYSLAILRNKCYNK